MSYYDIDVPIQRVLNTLFQLHTYTSILCTYLYKIFIYHLSVTRKYDVSILRILIEEQNLKGDAIDFRESINV